MIYIHTLMQEMTLVKFRKVPLFVDRQILATDSTGTKYEYVLASGKYLEYFNFQLKQMQHSA